MAIDASVRKTQPRAVAYISMKGPYTQISDTFVRLFSWIGKKGLQPVGPPMGLYFNAPGQVPDEELLWELRAPVGGDPAQSAPDAEGVGVKVVEAVEVAAALHKGPFDGVGSTYQELVGWIVENGYEIVGPGEEVYLSDPQNTSPADLLTEVRFPVRKK